MGSGNLGARSFSKFLKFRWNFDPIWKIWTCELSEKLGSHQGDVVESDMSSKMSSSLKGSCRQKLVVVIDVESSSKV